VVIIAGRHIQSIAQKYPDAADEITAWVKVVRTAQWQNMVDVRAVYRDADLVRGFVVFNVRHNRYRLITVIHFAKTRDGKTTQGHVYIRSFLTHRQYDNPANWDKEFGS
jgi:mRNA interferase HigB